MNEKIICRECGHSNNINLNQCSQCDESLRNYNYFKNDFKDFYKLFNSNNIELLKEIPLTDTAYNAIVNNVIEIGSENIMPVPYTFETQNLIKIAKPYARVQYDFENKHPDYLSYYSFNRIFINRNTPSQVIPGAIIHELSHHLFNEIIKQSLLHLLNIEMNLYVESFAWYLTLQNEYLKIANEYVSHRTQEHFDADHFTGYSSLLKLLDENDDLDENKVETAINIGHFISEDVIFILEKYVSPLVTLNPNFSDNYLLGYNIKHMDEQSKLNAMYTIIRNTFEYVSNHKRDMQPILDEFNKSYIRYNI